MKCCGLLIPGLVVASLSVAAEASDPLELVPDDAAAVVVVDLSALRASAAVQAALEGVRPHYLYAPLAALAGAGVGADALPDGTLVLATGSLDPAGDDVLMAFSVDEVTAELEAAIGAALNRFGPDRGDGVHLRASLAATRVAPSLWVGGSAERVLAARTPPAQDVDVIVPVANVTVPPGAVLAAHFADVDLPNAPWSAWLGAVDIVVAIDPVGSVQAHLSCDAERAGRLADELRETLTSALATPQLLALAPGPLPTPVVEPTGTGVRVELTVPAPTWSALVQTATSAIQSEYR